MRPLQSALIGSMLRFLLPMLLLILLIYKAAIAEVPFATALHGTFLLPGAALLAILALLDPLRPTIVRGLVLAAAAILALALLNELAMLLIGLNPVPGTVRTLFALALVAVAFVTAERGLAAVFGPSGPASLLAALILLPLLALAQGLEHHHHGSAGPYQGRNPLLWMPLLLPATTLVAARPRLFRMEPGSGAAPFTVAFIKYNLHRRSPSCPGT